MILIINKVEICGVNTSKLPVIKEKKELIIKMREGDKKARETFIQGNLRLVLSVIQRFNNRGENVDDLFQVGCIGLMKAIDNFDLEQNVKFSTYAVPMIIGEIRRYLRDNNAIRVSRSLRDISYKVSKEREMYINEKNEEPTIQYLAEKVGESEEDVILAMESMVQPISIFDAAYNDGGDVIYILDQLKNEKNEMEHLTDKICVLQAIEKLSDKEKNIIKRRYFDNKTQIELADEIGISQAQVSRIEKVAIARMKKRLERGI